MDSREKLQKAIEDSYDFLNDIAAEPKPSVSQPDKDNGVSNDSDWSKAERVLKIIGKLIVVVICFLIVSVVFVYAEVIISKIVTLFIAAGGLFSVPVIKRHKMKKENIKISYREFLASSPFFRIMAGVVMASYAIVTLLLSVPSINTFASQCVGDSFEYIAQVVKDNPSDEQEVSDDKEELPVEEEVDDESSEEKEVYYDASIKVVLNDVNKSSDLTQELIDRAIYNVNNQEDVVAYFYDIYQSNESASHKYDNFMSTEIDNYNNKVRNAEKIMQSEGPTEKWHSELPTENDLLNAINSLESHLNEKPNYDGYFDLSNYYQDLALEYLNQGSYIETAKYYYVKSIICDINAISCADNKHDVDKSLNRMYYRYSDINRDCASINSAKESDAFVSLMYSLLDYSKP